MRLAVRPLIIKVHRLNRMIERTIRHVMSKLLIDVLSRTKSSHRDNCKIKFTHYESPKMEKRRLYKRVTPKPVHSFHS